MPGVPSGKGCMACRKQKKKCDQQKPSCSRCARLHISCIGAGQQRYRFKPVNFDNSTVAGRVKAEPVFTIRTDIPLPLSNELSITASRFVAALDMPDLRYSLRCYGEFLEHIPRRLGQNEALDASVKALVSAFPCHYTGQLPAEALVDSIHALKAIRARLNDSNTTLMSETLCAVYFTMICQGWRSDDHVQGHGKMLAHLTSVIITQKHKGDFELSILKTMSVPVITEAMVNPLISLSAWSAELATSLPPEPTDTDQSLRVPSLEIRKMVGMPKFYHHPQYCIEEIKSYYRDMCADQPRVYQHLVDLGGQMDSSANESDPINIDIAKLLHRYEVVYALLLNLISNLNSMLRAVNPEDSSLVEEGEITITRQVSLAENVSRHRPLGASFIPPLLASTWATSQGLAGQVELERMMMEYQPDSPHIKWMDEAVWLNCIHRGLLFQLAEFSSPQLAMAGGKSLNESRIHCNAAFGPSGSCLFR